MVKIQNDVIYDPKNKLKADLYQPDAAAYGAIIDLHGGGWFRGDKAKDADIAMAFAKLGYLVIVPNYRFTPEVYYPEPLVDVDSAITWLAQNGFSRQRILVFGSSAGGNMAIELAIKYGIPAVSWSGILDIDDWLAEHENIVAKNDTGQDFNKLASAAINQSGADDPFYKWFIMNYLQDEKNAKAATPWRRINEKTGPLFLANSIDEFVPTSGVLKTAQVMANAKVPLTLKLLPGTQHAKGYKDLVWQDTLNFIKTYLPPTTD